MSAAAWMWIAIGASVLTTIFSSLFHALREVSRRALEDLADARGNEGARRRIDHILEDAEGHANAAAVLRIATNLTIAVALVYWARGLAGPETPEWAPILTGLLVSVLMVWVFGASVPHAVAKHLGPESVYAWSRVLRAAYYAAAPFHAVARAADEIVRRLVGRPREAPSQVLEAELLSVVEEGQEEGQFDQTERRMIEAIVRFKEKTVQQIMTPRTEMKALEMTNNLGDVTRAVKRIGHSRIPVYEGTRDKIVGIFYVKDLMLWLAGEGKTGRGFELKGILRPAIFVPETKTIRELLTELLEKKIHLAMVADEYGGTAGLVTIEDILEEIVGEIKDEYEIEPEAQPEVRTLEGRGAVEIDARAYIARIADELAPAGIEIPPSEDYDTVGGFVVVSLGRIPAAGEIVRLGELLVTVLDAEPTRVKRVRIEKIADESDAPPAPAEPDADKEPALEPQVRVNTPASSRAVGK